MSEVIVCLMTFVVDMVVTAVGVPVGVAVGDAVGAPVGAAVGADIANTRGEQSKTTVAATVANRNAIVERIGHLRLEQVSVAKCCFAFGRGRGAPPTAAKTGTRARAGVRDIKSLSYCVLLCSKAPRSPARSALTCFPSNTPHTLGADAVC